MIDPKELRVGAHVDCKGSRYEVSGIIGDIVALIVKRHPLKGCEIEYFPSDYISPIPLTPELLTEIGFELIKDHGGVLEYKHEAITIQFWGERIGLRILVGAEEERSKRGMAVFSIRYLHELEAFVYLATKTELIKSDI